MQSVNGAHFLNLTPLILSSYRFAVSSAPAPVIVMVPFTNMYSLLKSHKLDFNIEVSKLIWVLVLHVPRESSFILA